MLEARRSGAFSWLLAAVSERDVDLSTPRHGERIADVVISPLPEPEGAVVIALQERSLAQRIDRQLLHRGAVRSMNGMAAVLAAVRCPSLHSINSRSSPRISNLLGRKSMKVTLPVYSNSSSTAKSRSISAGVL